MINKLKVYPEKTETVSYRDNAGFVKSRSAIKLPVFKEWTKSGRLTQHKDAENHSLRVFVKTEINRTKTASESTASITSTSIKFDDSCSGVEQSFNHSKSVANDHLINRDIEMTDHGGDERSTSNPQSCSSVTLSANNLARTQTGGMVSRSHEYGALNPSTPLSISSTSSDTRTRSRNNHNVSFFDQLKTLPSIHEANVP